ncbi:MAG: valine--tRNA ligase [Actinomycetota bacterium]|nr:valine--tRNA ligase [Actinomycetota bacterium]
MKREISPAYNPKDVEDKWYSHWFSKGYFHAPIDRSREPFTIVIPPPNITGSLHMGHALNNILQDIIVRKKRMEGCVTLWLPGTDHAGIATQNVVEQELAREGLTRRDLGREKFLEKVWEWKEKYGSTIINQLKRLGCSCDWDRERFTMDEGYSRAVKTVFVGLFKEGLIYRGNYIINWCPRCYTALSDLEVDHEEREGSLWYIKYPFEDSQEYLTIATTRPETLLGDTAVAVHPNDERYQKYVGKTLILPFLRRKISIIADEYVDPEFGTGAVKVTPAHDPNDFEIGQRHKLPQVVVLTPDAKINENGGPYNGMDRYECREAILKDLEREGLLEKVEPHLHAVGHCYRCETVVEPYLSEQWFIKMKPLAESAIKAVKEGKVKFTPKRWEKVYFDWMYNIKDWCISRQIWWGHQIPVWYCDRCGEIIVEMEEPTSCTKCGNLSLRQDTDVLDTWFSSALWPFAVFGWPEKTEDLSYFYPTSLLSTGFDIIYFWVARMIIMGLHFMHDVPFREVYIHALIRDALGRKMSKSLGNVIDPIDMIGKYGTDALRFTLAALATPGRDIFLSEEKIEGNRNFVNKIWNASRFVLMNLEGYSPEEAQSQELEYTLADRWILSRYTRTVSLVEENMNSYNFSEACRILYDFFWGEFCDWYIELTKPRLYPTSDEQRATSGLERLTAQHVLLWVLGGTLRLLHPFMPFVTEEIWQRLPALPTRKSIVIAPWPKSDPSLIDATPEREMGILKDVTVAIRSIRSTFRLHPRGKIHVFLKPPSQDVLEILQANSNYISQLAGVSELTMDREISRPEHSAAAVEHGIEIFIPLAGLIDIEKERSRLGKKLMDVKKELQGVERKLSRKKFLEKASPEVVEKEKRKFAALVDKKKKLELQLKQIG